MFLTRRVFCASALTAALPIPRDDLDGMVRDALRVWGVPGASVAVVREGKVEYLAGLGRRSMDEKGAVTPQTLFPLGSCTKGFTTAALALLESEGKLDWDDPVRKHVDCFRLSDPLADRRIVLRDLLCHRTGLGTHDLLWYRAPWGPRESVRRAGALPLDHPFRSTFRYQSTMFSAAGFAVESASGHAWHDFVRKRLFEPLEMKTAGTSTTAFRSGDRAVGHRPTGRGGAAVLPEWCPCPNPDAAYTIHASAADLCGWLKFQLHDRSVTETHLPQMIVPMSPIDRALQPDTMQMSYGLGWVIHDHQGVKVVAHSGVLEGFRVQLTLVPQAKLGIAVLSNLHATRMNMALTQMLLDALLGLERKDRHGMMTKEIRNYSEAAERERKQQESRRRPGTSPSRQLKEYAGIWEHPAYGKARIVERADGLRWSWGAFAGTLTHFHHDTFTLDLDHLGSTTLTFALDAAGEPSAMTVSDPFGVSFRR